jgi:MFS family permease
MSAYPFVTAFLAPISGFLSDKISYKPLTVIGLTLNTVVLFRLSTINTSTSGLEFVILMALLGAGVAIFQSPNNSSIMGSVPRDQLGIAGGINALFRNLGMVSGTTLSVLLFSYFTKINMNSLNNNTGGVDSASFLTGFRVVLIFAAISCLVGAVITLTRTFEIKEKSGLSFKKPAKE